MKQKTSKRETRNELKQLFFNNSEENNQETPLKKMIDQFGGRSQNCCTPPSPLRGCDVPESIYTTASIISRQGVI